MLLQESNRASTFFNSNTLNKALESIGTTTAAAAILKFLYTWQFSTNRRRIKDQHSSDTPLVDYQPLAPQPLHQQPRRDRQNRRYRDRRIPRLPTAPERKRFITAASTTTISCILSRIICSNRHLTPDRPAGAPRRDRSIRILQRLAVNILPY